MEENERYLNSPEHYQQLERMADAIYQTVDKLPCSDDKKTTIAESMAFSCNIM